MLRRRGEQRGMTKTPFNARGKRKVAKAARKVVDKIFNPDTATVTINGQPIAKEEVEEDFVVSAYVKQANATALLRGTLWGLMDEFGEHSEQLNLELVRHDWPQAVLDDEHVIVCKGVSKQIRIEGQGSYDLETNEFTFQTTAEEHYYVGALGADYTPSKMQVPDGVSNWLLSSLGVIKNGYGDHIMFAVMRVADLRMREDQVLETEGPCLPFAVIEKQDFVRRYVQTETVERALGSVWSGRYGALRRWKNWALVSGWKGIVEFFSAGNGVCDGMATVYQSYQEWKAGVCWSWAVHDLLASPNRHYAVIDAIELGVREEIESKIPNDLSVLGSRS